MPRGASLIAALSLGVSLAAACAAPTFQSHHAAAARLASAGDQAGAAERLEAALLLAETEEVPPADLVAALSGLAEIYAVDASLGQSDQVEVLLGKARELADEHLSAEDPARLEVLEQLGVHYARAERFEEARAPLEAYLAAAERSLGPERAYRSSAAAQLVRVYAALGWSEKRAALEERIAHPDARPPALLPPEGDSPASPAAPRGSELKRPHRPAWIRSSGGPDAAWLTEN